MLYLKPVQTGFPIDSDARYVYQEVARVGRLRPEAISEGLLLCNHTLQVSPAVQKSVRMADVVTRPNFAGSRDDPSSSLHSTGMLYKTCIRRIFSPVDVAVCRKFFLLTSLHLKLSCISPKRPP